MKKLANTLFFIALSLNSISQARDFYNQAVRSTVLLYVKNSDGNLKTFGTGFIFYNHAYPDKQILITCRHLSYHDTLIVAIPASDSIKAVMQKSKVDILREHIGTKTSVYSFDGENLLTPIPLKLDLNLFRHPSLDLAVIMCDLPTKIIKDDNSIVAFTDLVSITRSDIAIKGNFYVGREVCFIGFPFGIGSANGYYDIFSNTSIYADLKTNPLIRKAIISWLSNNSNTFLIDGFSFGGNSGSPIYSLPNLEENAKFLGMVTGHLPEPVDIFEIDTIKNSISASKVLVGKANNGLAICIPSFEISEFVDEVLARIGKKR